MRRGGGLRLASRGHRVRVYCRTSNRRGSDLASYRGMELIHRGALPRRSLETISHSALSVGHLIGRRTDVAIVFNAANSLLLPALRSARIPVATHVDGLEWKRAKWGTVGSQYYRAAERLAIRWSDALIADARGIADYYRERFDAETELITYGAPNISAIGDTRLAEVGLASKGYHLAVARFEPENNIDVIVRGYRRSKARLPLVVVGSAPYADEYTRSVHSLADERVRFLGGVWDQDLLDQLYAHAFVYLHGHSVGGTNPSLLRAIGAGTPTVAFDVGFNRDVLGDVGWYFRNSEEVAQFVTDIESDPEQVAARGKAALTRAAAYDWDDVTVCYEQLCRRLAAKYESNISDVSGSIELIRHDVSVDDKEIEDLSVPIPRNAS